jgi:hypothetical protein
MSESSAEKTERFSPLSLVVEDFGRSHPGLNPDLLIEPTRVALSRYHQSPAGFKVISPQGETTASVHFGVPDPRSVNTIERERCVEEGAILFGAMLLAELERIRITRVVPRRGRANYFLERSQEPGFWLLEVSGTDEGDIQARKRSKMQQLQSTPYRDTTSFRGGYVAVTRFAPDACSLLEEWTLELGS